MAYLAQNYKPFRPDKKMGRNSAGKAREKGRYAAALNLAYVLRFCLRVCPLFHTQRDHHALVHFLSGILHLKFIKHLHFNVQGSAFSSNNNL